MEFNMKVKRGQILKELRKRKKLNQGELAEYMGVSVQAYQKYEYGTAEPSFDSICKLAEFYGETTDYLLGRDVPPSEYLTESEKDLEACILEKYKQLPESYRKKFLQGVMEAVEIQRREQTTKQTTKEQVSCEEHNPDTKTIQKTIVKPKAAARDGTVPNLEDEEYWAMVDASASDTTPDEFESP